MAVIGGPNDKITRCELQYATGSYKYILLIHCRLKYELKLVPIEIYSSITVSKGHQCPNSNKLANSEQLLEVDLAALPLYLEGSKNYS
jgi:hypothetical protein